MPGGGKHSDQRVHGVGARKQKVRGVASESHSRPCNRPARVFAFAPAVAFRSRGVCAVKIK